LIDEAQTISEHFEFAVVGWGTAGQTLAAQMATGGRRIDSFVRRRHP
jgi:choline dehydrogenase-like flavoprotein